MCKFFLENMLSLWFVLVYLMADVVPRGHVGDRVRDPPFPDPFGAGLTRLKRFLQGE
ncbi:hypothetical protein Hanom_Chr04g00312361 [Helianthus anomalus]